MQQIQIRIEGDQADTCSAALRQFLVEKWDIKPQIIADKALPASDNKIEPGTILGLASIVLSLPGFLESKMVSNLTLRIQAKQRLQTLVDWSLAHLPESNTRIWVELDGKPFLLNADNLAEMLNALSEPNE